MFDIEIDISGTIEDYKFLVKESKQLTTALLNRISKEYRTRWKTMVSGELKRTKKEYLGAIQVEKKDDNTIAFQLLNTDSNLPIKLEEGAQAWDIKQFLKQGKTKKGLGGNWYVDVPFRFKTGKGPIVTAGFSANLPSSVKQKAIERKGAAVRQGDLKGDLASPKIRDAIIRPNKVIPHYQHKVSIYQGVRRQEVGNRQVQKSLLSRLGFKEHKVTGRNRGAFISYRRVSENSDNNSWIHKGFHARNFMDRTADSMEWGNIVDTVIKEFLKKR